MHWFHFVKENTGIMLRFVLLIYSTARECWQSPSTRPKKLGKHMFYECSVAVFKVNDSQIIEIHVFILLLIFMCRFKTV